MYLTAQRPLVEGAFPWPGINTYLYLHGFTWSSYPPPNRPPAQFERKHELVGFQPGRRIRSYLDLVGPDDARSDEVARAVEHIHNVVVTSPTRPWVHVCGRCMITFVVEPTLDPAWDPELHLLWQEAERLWSDPTYVTP